MVNRFLVFEVWHFLSSAAEIGLKHTSDFRRAATWTDILQRYEAIAVAWSAYNKFCMDRVVIMTTYRDRVSLLTHTLMYSIQKTVMIWTSYSLSTNLMDEKEMEDWMLGIKILKILKFSIVGKVPYFYFDICKIFC